MELSGSASAHPAFSEEALGRHGEKEARALKVGVNTCALVLTSVGVMSA